MSGGGYGYPPFEERAVGPGVEADFLSAWTTGSTPADGSLDPGVVTGATGDPQFRIVFDVIGSLGSTTIQIGTFAEYSDVYNGVQGTDVVNTSVTITVVPEPSTALLVGIGLAGLAAAKRS